MAPEEFDEDDPQRLADRVRSRGMFINPDDEEMRLASRVRPTNAFGFWTPPEDDDLEDEEDDE